MNNIRQQDPKNYSDAETLFSVETSLLLAFKEDVVELFKADHLVPIQISLRYIDTFLGHSSFYLNYHFHQLLTREVNSNPE